jgi:hypothetical protein
LPWHAAEEEEDPHDGTKKKKNHVTGRRSMRWDKEEAPRDEEEAPCDGTKNKKKQRRHARKNKPRPNGRT